MISKCTTGFAIGVSFRLFGRLLRTRRPGRPGFDGPPKKSAGAPASPDLAGIQDPVGIEERLHGPHDLERRPVLARGVAPVPEPHPVLARARAAEPDR